MDRGINMNIWITELGGKDIIVEQDWLTSIKPVINWKTRELELNQGTMKEIPDWIKDLADMFEKFPDNELPSKRPEMDHEINLTQENISPVLLIPKKPQNYAMIKE